MLIQNNNNYQFELFNFLKEQIELGEKEIINYASECIKKFNQQKSLIKDPENEIKSLITEVFKFNDQHNKNKNDWIYDINDVFSYKILYIKEIVEKLQKHKIDLNMLELEISKVRSNTFAEKMYSHLKNFIINTYQFDNMNLYNALPLLLCEDFNVEEFINHERDNTNSFIYHVGRNVEENINNFRVYAKEANEFCYNFLKSLLRLGERPIIYENMIIQLYRLLFQLQISEGDFKANFKLIFGYENKFLHEIFNLLEKHTILYKLLAQKALASETYRLDEMKKILKDNNIDIKEFKYSCSSPSKNKQLTK